MTNYYQCNSCLAINDVAIPRCTYCGIGHHEGFSDVSKQYVKAEDYHRLREGIEWWLKRMEYYSDNQYGKAEMRKLVETND